MSFSIWPFNRKKEPVPKQREYTYGILEGHWIGDKYIYTIKAESAHGAAVILVRWFFGRGKLGDREAVKQDHYNVTKPFSEVHRVEQNDIFSFKGADMMKLAIGGYTHRPDVKKWLRNFARENNIELSNDLKEEHEETTQVRGTES